MKKYKFTPKKETKKTEDKVKEIVKTVEKIQVKDSRLDKLVPLFMDILERLLGSAGMLRYRKDLTEKVKEVMDEETKQG